MEQVVARETELLDVPAAVLPQSGVQIFGIDGRDHYDRDVAQGAPQGDFSGQLQTISFRHLVVREDNVDEVFAEVGKCFIDTCHHCDVTHAELHEKPDHDDALHLVVVDNEDELIRKAFHGKLLVV